MSYFGGKSGAGVFQTLINLMPPHEVYVEPFLGGAAVMRLKRPAALNIGIDLDAGPIAAYVESAGPPGVAISAEIGGNGDTRSLTAESGAECRRESSKLLVPPGAARTAARVRCGDSSGPTIAIDDDDGSRALYGGTVPPLIAGPIAETDGKRSPIAWTNDKGLHWHIRRGCAIDYLQELEYEGPGVLIYCDPPYLHSTRASSHRYANEMTDVDHCRLLRVLRSLKCNVMISGYSSALYAKELKGWNATAFQAATRGAPAAEWVWYNFDRPTKRLHDYQFLGDDFRERERIRRRQKRWCRKLEHMPLLERRALMERMNEMG